MTKTIKAIATLAAAFLSVHFSAYAAQAAYMTFDPLSYSKKVGDIITVPIVIDSEGTPMRAADIYISYDATKLSPTSIVPNRDFFPQISNQTITGKIYVSAEQNDSTLNVTGRGVVASINFEIISAGSSQITFDCDQNSAKTSKIIEASANNYAIIECSKYGTASVQGASTSTGGTTPTSTPMPTPTTRPSSGTTNPPPTTTLPKSGAVENSLIALALGGALSLVGVGLRFLVLKH